MGRLDLLFRQYMCDPFDLCFLGIKGWNGRVSLLFFYGKKYADFDFYLVKKPIIVEYYTVAIGGYFWEDILVVSGCKPLSPCFCVDFFSNAEGHFWGYLTIVLSNEVILS